MNEVNTLGRRIQEGRRAAGLSQEALGERLNVSRQAVSKWEADAAIPELENLIAMSRVFGVSVGELLGVEDPAGAGGLTERERAAVEAVAAGYAGEQSRRAEKRLRAAAVLGGVEGLCLLALAAVAAFHIASVNRRLDNLQMQLDSVRNQSTVVVQQPETSDPLLAASDVVITDLDPEAETITLRLSATPAEQKVETTASFAAALADGSVLTRDADGEGGTAFAVRDWTIPMSESVELSVILPAETMSVPWGWIISPPRRRTSGSRCMHGGTPPGAAPARCGWRSLNFSFFRAGWPRIWRSRRSRRRWSCACTGTKMPRRNRPFRWRRRWRGGEAAAMWS